MQKGAHIFEDMETPCVPFGSACQAAGTLIASDLHVELQAASRDQGSWKPEGCPEWDSVVTKVPHFCQIFSCSFSLKAFCFGTPVVNAVVLIVMVTI